MINIQIRQLRDDIIDMLNSSDLPVEVKRLVVLEVSGMLNKASDDCIIKQKQDIVNQLAAANEATEETSNDSE